jgi:hypothetical protein
VALFDLQNLTDLGKIRVLCDDIYTASSHDVCHHAISRKDKGFSDAEVVEGPVPIAFTGIKDKPEVSCVSVCMLSGFHKYRTARFPNIWYSEHLTLVGSSFLKADIFIHNTGHVQRSSDDHPSATPPSQSVCMTCSDHTESAVLLLLTFIHKYLLHVPILASKQEKMFIRSCDELKKVRKAIRLAIMLEITKRIEGQ